MKVVCKFSRSKVVAGQPHELDLLVRLLAPTQPSTDRRPGLCIVPVVDVSGSMAGDKLEAVRRALLRLFDHLVPGDRVALVAFDSTVRVLAPLVEVTAARRAELCRAAQSLRAGDTTNLAGGLLEALRLVRASAPGPRARVILLTDGNANAGPATSRDELVALARSGSRGVAISAFGYGADCEQVVLADMADAGGGSYAYIKDEDAVLTAFARELGGLLSTYGGDVRLRIRPPDAAPIDVRLGDLLHGGELATCIGVTVPAHALAKSAEVCTVEARWQDARGQENAVDVVARLDFVPPGNESPADDPEVARARDERILREAVESAERAARKHDLAAATAVLHQALAKITDPDLTTFLRATLLPSYEDSSAYAHQTALRAGSLQALKRKRRVAETPDLPDCLMVAATPAESEMEKSFRAPGSKKKRAKASLR